MPVAVEVKQREDAANWVWLSLLPMGLGAWAPIYAWTVVRRRAWLLLGLLWSVIAVAGWAVAIATDGSALSGLLIILGWAGAIATSFGIRSSYRQLSGSSFEEAVAGAEQRLRERDRARELASGRPALAKELGIGRPDLPQAHDAGLIDVNNAPVSVLSKLPGLDGALAKKIVEARAQTHGFASVEDLGMSLDLDGDTVERLRSLVVFLPGN